MIYALTNTQFVRMLENFSVVLDKAEQHAQAKKFDFSVLLDSRLAPDQFAFTRQVQIMCDTAKRAAGYLTGKEAPVQADDETTLVQLRSRIDFVAKYLKGFQAKDYEGAAQRKVSQPRWEGQWLTGEEYVMHHVIPNFYFHFTTAYAILRHNGVDVGKKDYLGKMPYKK